MDAYNIVLQLQTHVIVSRETLSSTPREGVNGCMIATIAGPDG
jgi:hypothetical protein